MAGNCTGANTGAIFLEHRARTHASARRAASDRRRHAAQGCAQHDAVRPRRAGGVTSGSLKAPLGLQIVLTGHAGGPFTSAAGWCDIGRGLDPGPSDQGAPGIAKGCAREQDQDHETPEPIEEIGTQEADEPGRVAQGRRLVRQGIAIGGNQGSAAVAESPASPRFIAGFRQVEPRVCGPFAPCRGGAKGWGRSLCVPRALMVILASFPGTGGPAFRYAGMHRPFRPPVKARRERRWRVRREPDDEQTDRDDAILDLGGEEKPAAQR